LARAAQIAPHLTATELDGLTDGQLDTTPASLVCCPETLPEVSEGVFVNRPRDTLRIGDQRYLDPEDVSVRVDDGLAKPRLEFRLGADGRPLARIDTPVWDGPGFRSHRFEFDTSPDFTSPNLWRCPTLDPKVDGENLGDDRDVSHYAMRTRDRNPRAGQSLTVSFPFPAAAMCLPDARSEIGFQHIELLAAALASEGTVASTVDAVFRYAQAKYAHANDTAFRPPVEVIRASMGGCGHVNFLAGLLLELNGIRCRGVAGFDPALRQAYPGAGHTAIELLDPATDRWEYFDPYLDVRLPGRAASDMPRDPEASSIPLAKIDPQFHHLGNFIDLGRIFRYRIYLDLLRRLPNASMLQLEGREDSYGRDWRLFRPGRSNRAPPPFRRAIHARARFVYSEQAISQWRLKLEQAPVASPWAYATISPWKVNQAIKKLRRRARKFVSRRRLSLGP
jgi:hypothetical protein